MAGPEDVAVRNAVSAAPAGAPIIHGDTWWRVVARTAFPFLVVGAAWEIVARLGVFPRRLFPPLGDVASAAAELKISHTGS